MQKATLVILRLALFFVCRRVLSFCWFIPTSYLFNKAIQTLSIYQWIRVSILLSFYYHNHKKRIFNALHLITFYIITLTNTHRN